MKNEGTIAAERWAKEIFKEDFLILDTETTGLGKKEEICQIAICDKYGRALMNTLVRPTIPISYYAQKIHGISDKMVANAPRFSQIHPQLIKTVSGKNVVIYNAPFDRRLIRQCCDLHQLAYPRCKEIHCAMKWNSQWYAWETKGGKNRKKPLMGGDHSAMGDCLAVLKLIKQIAGVYKMEGTNVVKFPQYHV